MPTSFLGNFTGLGQGQDLGVFMNTPPNLIGEETQNTTNWPGTHRWAPTLFLESRPDITLFVSLSLLLREGLFASSSLISQHFLCTLFFSLSMLHCRNPLSYLSPFLEGKDKMFILLCIYTESSTKSSPDNDWFKKRKKKSLRRAKSCPLFL